MGQVVPARPPLCAGHHYRDLARFSYWSSREPHTGVAVMIPERVRQVPAKLSGS